MNRISSVDRITLSETQMGYDVMIECTTIFGDQAIAEVNL